MSELKTLGSFRAKQAVGCSLSELMALRYMRGAVRTYSGKSEGISTKMRTEMKKPKIQGNPERMSAEDLRGLTEADWLYLLDHNPSDEGASRVATSGCRSIWTIAATCFAGIHNLAIVVQMSSGRDPKADIGRGWSLWAGTSGRLWATTRTSIPSTSTR